MTESATPCGRHIHMAARALQSVRDTALEQAGIVFPNWVVLEAVTENPGMDRETLIRRLVDMPVHDDAGAGRAVSELHDSGLITTSADDLGVLAVTSTGQVLVDKVTATRTSLRQQLYGGIPPQDMSTTARVLELIAARARDLHATQSTSAKLN